MAQKLPLFFCVLALASIPAFGENIPFSGSGGAGTVLGMPFIYDADGGVFLGDWSIGGVGAGGTPWTGSVTASDFVITFSLPFGSDIDPTLVSIGSAAGCQGGTFGGTTFCTTSGVPWTPDLTSNNTLAFFAPAGNDLSPGQDFFVNIFFDGID